MKLQIAVQFGMSQRPANEKAPRGEPGGAGISFIFRRVALRKQGKS